MEIWANSVRRMATAVTLLPAIPALRMIAAGMCVFFAAQCLVVRADEPVKWRTGSELAKALRASLDRTGNDKPVGESLTALSRATAVAILLDRRVDPNQTVSIDAHGVPLADELKRIASTLQLGMGTIGPVQYLGPKSTAARVEILSELGRREATQSGHKSWLKTAPSGWDDLTEPRVLAQSIAADAGAKINNPEAIPHDVWAEWSGPPLAHVERLTLVLAGFDLSFDLSGDGTEVEIVPAPDQLTFERTYEVTDSVSKVSAQLKRLLPDIKVQASGAKAIRVAATAEQHAQVADLLAGKSTTTKTVVVPGEKQYTLNAKDQVIGAMVQTLAKDRGLKVQWSESIIDKLKQRGSVEFEKVSFETALKKVLDPVGIKYKLTEKTLELSE
jgi:hypothetical protein